ncbi:MlaD family protein [Gordonia sp. HY442]|uniref:MlaD family protein n=1 Tax=Gordonia zhenghanii TaxID=2911516 RepID=UPI001F3F570B|nr:MlaD family protein [Gordonia zhenghanii]MCF8603475.1 MlaD family protein [Gordonia zhenghanii]
MHSDRGAHMLSGGRGRALVVTLVVALLVAGGVLVYVKRSGNDTTAVCAKLPDAAGLYAGNAVNIRGVRVGTVSEVSPSPGFVTVRMTIDDRPLGADTKVVAVNNSVLADRRLELVDASPNGGARLATDHCVPLSRGFTPISVSTAFASFTTMLDDMGGPDGVGGDKPLGELISQAQSQLAGIGPDLNKILHDMSGVMSDPNEFLSQMRSVFDNVAVLTDVAGRNWSAIRDIGVNSADLTHLMGSLFKSFVYIFDGLGEAAPGLDDLLGNVAPPMLDLTDDFKPMIDVGLNRLDDLTAMLREMPGIAKSLEASLSRKRGSFAVTVTPPKVAAATPDSSALCTAMNASDAGSCDPKSPRSAVVDLGTLVTRMVQGGRR